MTARIGIVDDETFDKHACFEGAHPERPERLHAIRQRLELSTAGPAVNGSAAERAVIVAPPLTRLPSRSATDAELLRVHAESHLARLDQSAGRSGFLDPDTYLSPGSAAAARLAAGGGLALFEALRAGSADYGVALVRPPGHHARAAQAMGFCLINNAAVLAAHARAQGLERVFILDWDVHHGNGTEEIFYADPSVFYLSLHQYPFYPGTGAPEDAGEGEGLGSTLNIALSAGADDRVYAEAFRRIVTPAVEQFRPDLVIVSAGFDAHASDPLGGMALSESAYADMTRQLLGALPERGRGRVAMLLEGGYDLRALAASVAATLSALDESEGSASEGRVAEGSAVGSAGGAPSAANAGISTRHAADLQRIQRAASRYLRL